MAIIVYSSETDVDEQRLLKRIRFTDTVICRSVDELQCRLDIPGNTRKIIILCLKTHEEIIRITKLVELYSDLLFIVILCHDQSDTNRAAFRLRPRYIAYKDGNFKDVAAVLYRIMLHTGNPARRNLEKDAQR